MLNAPRQNRVQQTPVTASAINPHLMAASRVFPFTRNAAPTTSKSTDKVPVSTVAAAGPEAADSDQALVARAKGGDADAFSALVTRYHARLYGLVYHMTSNNEDARDLTQEIFLKAYRSIGGFQGNSSFYTWLHTIGKNMTINFLKKRGKRWQMSLDDVDSNIQNDKEFLEQTATSDPVREANLSELQRRLNEAMQKLSVEHRMVVTMFDIQGMPHAEISKVLGVSEGTVRSRLFYAHRQLQNYLEEFRS